MRIFDFSGDQNLSDSPSWAKRFSRYVASLFTEEGPQPQPDLVRYAPVTDLTTDGVQAVQTPISWKAAQTRKSVFLDVEMMDSNDELVSTALDILADCAVNFLDSDSDVRIELRTQDKRVEAILSDLIVRLDLNNDLWQIVREMVKHGSIFREVVLDRSTNDPKIIAFKQTISWTIWPNESKLGDKIPGWIQRTEQHTFSDGGQKLEEWQIIPFLYGTKYGYLHVGPLTSARRNWQRIQKMEDGMAVARLTRAYDKNVHRVPVNSNWTKDEIMGAIQRYKDAITRKRMVSDQDKLSQGDMPFDAQTDFYLPDDGSKRGGVESLSSTNNQLMNLTDVYYLREKLLARLKVPLGFMQITSTLKTHVSAGQGTPDADLQFARTLKGIQSSLRRGIKRLFDTELILHGVIPADGLYDFVLCPIRVENDFEQAKIQLTLAQAAAYFSEAFGALPPEILADKFLRVSDKSQEVLDKFFAKEGKQIFEAKVKAIKNAAVPKPTGGGGTGGGLIKDRVVGGDVGSGNNNKSKVARSSEQIGTKDVQSVSGPELVEAFVELHQTLQDDLRATGADVPEVSDAEVRSRVLSRLGEIAHEDELIFDLIVD